MFNRRIGLAILMIVLALIALTADLQQVEVPARGQPGSGENAALASAIMLAEFDLYGWGGGPGWLKPKHPWL